MSTTRNWHVDKPDHSVALVCGPIEPQTPITLNAAFSTASKTTCKQSGTHSMSGHMNAAKFSGIVAWPLEMSMMAWRTASWSVRFGRSRIAFSVLWSVHKPRNRHRAWPKAAPPSNCRMCKKVAAFAGASAAPYPRQPEGKVLDLTTPAKSKLRRNCGERSAATSRGMPERLHSSNQHPPPPPVLPLHWQSAMRSNAPELPDPSTAVAQSMLRSASDTAFPQNT